MEENNKATTMSYEAEKNALSRTNNSPQSPNLESFNKNNSLHKINFEKKRKKKL